METMYIKGPFSFRGENNLFDHLQSKRVHGFYLWCIHLGEDRYRVYYIGESVDIGGRNWRHFKDSLCGRIKGHCLDALRDDNLLIAKYRPHQGLIKRYAHLDPDEYLNEYIDSMHLFYGEVPKTAEGGNNKDLLQRFERAIYEHIEEQGQNILHVGRISSSPGEPMTVRIKTPDADIESLSDEVLTLP